MATVFGALIARSVLGRKAKVRRILVGRWASTSRIDMPIRSFSGSDSVSRASTRTSPGSST